MNGQGMQSDDDCNPSVFGDDQGLPLASSASRADLPFDVEEGLASTYTSSRPGNNSTVGRNGSRMTLLGGSRRSPRSQTSDDAPGAGRLGCWCALHGYGLLCCMVMVCCAACSLLLSCPLRAARSAYAADDGSVRDDPFQVLSDAGKGSGTWSGVLRTFIDDPSCVGFTCSVVQCRRCAWCDEP
jgi:hypothetical protein